MAVYGTARKERIDTLVQADDAGVSVLRDAWRRLKVSPLFWVGAVIITLFVLLAIVAPFIAPHDPAAQLLIGQTSRARNQIAPPQPGYLLGGDTLGRDLFSRLVIGSRQTLLVGVLATAIGLIGGLALGILAGAFGGWVDTVVMRIVDVLLSIPSLLLSISIAVLFTSPNLTSVIIAVSVVQIPVFARLLRGQMLAQRDSDHVLAARALGVKRAPIVFRHMLPNSISPVIVQSTLVVAISILDAAALSFLGLGSQDASTPEWGQMLGEAQDRIDSHPGLAFWPAGAIIVIALGFTLLGESLRDALDPKNRR
ncbi:ABC transporter permease [Nakamurella flavida]|uniref:ABC transporter permease n=1 Tax=Nakamurella flavida TaxID=363630 RepID=A0A938YER9_9ACTN|nr:ABC transporter permease [Nakamurella flavida]MBM9476330.1 ABC transporter permease [Nakamurella flavida]MDP9779569.1 peptide/nickel transport system permease protein [Nakamurella flavida]